MIGWGRWLGFVTRRICVGVCWPLVTSLLFRRFVCLFLVRETRRNLLNSPLWLFQWDRLRSSPFPKGQLDRGIRMTPLIQRRWYYLHADRHYYESFSKEGDLASRTHVLHAFEQKLTKFLELAILPTHFPVFFGLPSNRLKSAAWILGNPFAVLATYTLENTAFKLRTSYARVVIWACSVVNRIWWGITWGSSWANPTNLPTYYHCILQRTLIRWYSLGAR